MHFYHLILLPPEAANWRAEEIDWRCTEMMQPFDMSLEVASYKVWLDQEEVARMAPVYGLDPSDLRRLATHMDDWNGETGGVDERGLYYETTRNPEGRWDWWRIGGRWDGFVRGLDALPGSNGFNYGAEYESLARNICRVRDLPPAVACWSLLQPDGSWQEEGWAYRYCATFEDYQALPDEQRQALQTQVEQEWRTRCAEILSAHPDYLAVSCDIHR